jgi:hypothetical protein
MQYAWWHPRVEQQYDMPPLTDPERLQAYKNALNNWRFKGFIVPLLTDQCYRWIREELNEVPLPEIFQAMDDFVATGGVISEVRETRPEWSDKFNYHYDLLMMIRGKPVYLETRLCFTPPFVPDEPSILLVNIHAP